MIKKKIDIMTELEWDNLPLWIQDILMLLDDTPTYDDCKMVIEVLNGVGWTGEYDLDGGIINVKPL